MRQIGKGAERNLRDDRFVWVEGEVSADIDYNAEAQQNPDRDIPTHIPTDGYYLKATNANAKASQADRIGWYVAGAFRPNRIIGDAEARKIIDDWNTAHPGQTVEHDFPRESGRTFNAETMQLEDTPEQKAARIQEIETINNQFNARLAELEKDPTQKDRILKLGKPGHFLISGGMPNAQIQLEYDLLVKKSKDNYKHDHPFTVHDIKNLPIAINSPIAIFKSTHKGDNVILTELKKDGHNFIVVVRTTNQHRKGGVVIQVNEIKTLYPKKERGIINWILTNNIANIDKEKALQWIEALRPHAETPTDKEELDSATKIIDNFKNPSISGEKKSEGTSFPDATLLHYDSTPADDPRDPLTTARRIAYEDHQLRQDDRIDDRIDDPATVQYGALPTRHEESPSSVAARFNRTAPLPRPPKGNLRRHRPHPTPLREIRRPRPHHILTRGSHQPQRTPGHRPRTACHRVVRRGNKRNLLLHAKHPTIMALPLRRADHRAHLRP